MSDASFERARQLREEFDASFAIERDGAAERLSDVLVLGSAGVSYALRLSAVAGVYSNRRISPLPSPAAELLGVAGFRGVLVPVYGFAAFVGRAASSAPRWLVLLTSETPVALAFDTFEAHLRVGAEAFTTELDEPSGERPTRGALLDGGRAWPLVHAPSLLRLIERRARHFAPLKER